MTSIGEIITSIGTAASTIFASDLGKTILALTVGGFVVSAIIAVLNSRGS